jgi:S1-C subfamily serine protease
VLAVRPRSRAEDAGIHVGDQVRAVDGVPVRAPADVKDALADGRGAQVEVLRDGAAVVVMLDEAEGR